ncbi:MAG TPA: ABC transporter substrate-binding protein [Roseiarcus sp.]|jgi:ABC-type nitrate/sulfonate/bicarbonate transport system substrate-binding protein
MSAPSSVSRRSVLKSGAAVVAGSAFHPTWARASTTPAIPQATVRFGGFAVTNHAWTMLASKKGFLADVGITMAGGVPKSLLETQVIPQLQNGELDMTTYWFGLAIEALDKVPNVHPVLVYSFFQGSTLLGRPDKGYKTVDEFMAGGMAWPEAAAAAVQQVKGQKFAITASPSTYPWNNLALSLGGLSMKDADTIPVEDPKAVQLAINNQIDFAAPGGAVQVYQLQFQAGWKPIMSTRQMLKNMPAGTGSILNSLLNYDLIQTTDAYLEKNRDTVFRFCGAIYRTLDYIFGPNQQQALTEYAPFINAQTGAQMDAKSIKFIFEDLDPFFQWKDQPKIWEDSSYSLNYRNIYTYQIKHFIDQGTIPNQPYDLDKIFTAKSIWKEMLQMKQKSEGLIGKMNGSIGPDRQANLDAAKHHLASFNFLDAQRFAEAATA